VHEASPASVAESANGGGQDVDEAEDESNTDDVEVGKVERKEPEP
jgi:hypothetical protein